ncbi:MAG: SUMF1/EgtB/PvdO family nonheme iron enzyme [Akkermansiaceae bacterium]|nr:SUMF1/EgtB/PvdO family nonheme iron enzyme [Akkermansiaceae bacterium]
MSSPNSKKTAMAAKIRPDPIVPDHEVLRKIGGGAYGEVWLARGVTGALRAVKVVWREDFEDTRGFEREFEGILKFEPVSRNHPALVNILHVGRSADGVSFYYYVMELGDDLTTGQEINPVEYQPRTLRADNAQGEWVKWDTDECIDVGLRLAEALDHLHERGLAHRDVKPSNVIFVHGKAKLADIGLVAARGQRTFVGTEGFVPPEGPGSAQADVYSLGKVLYEIATGKDRLSFPELPDVMPTGSAGKRWLELNRIICDICEPRVSKRVISTAAELADALRRVQKGQRRRLKRSTRWIAFLILTGIAGWGAWVKVRGPAVAQQVDSAPAVAPAQVGMLRVISAPEGAEVMDAAGKWIGTTNTGLIQVNVGDDYFFKLKKSGYRPFTLQGKVPKNIGAEPTLLLASLENFSPPQVGEPWNDHLGNLYQPVDDTHVGVSLVSHEVWAQFIDSVEVSDDDSKFVDVLENGKTESVVLCSSGAARAFCDWFRKRAFKAGFLTDDQEVIALRMTPAAIAKLGQGGEGDDFKPLRVVVQPIDFGEVNLTTHPSGVEVYMNPESDPSNQVSVGSTRDSLVISKIKPGDWQFYLVREGYRPETINIQVGKGERLSRVVTLERSLGVVFGKPWENGEGMKFAPLGQDLMVSIWETRVGDYELYAADTAVTRAPAPYFSQGADHPVVNVSRDDAQAFCRWLTDRERKDERIAQTHEYRLPTDLEWSMMVGVQEGEGVSPGWRDARKERIFPWGTDWPPPPNVGNFADESAKHDAVFLADRTIQGVDDGFGFTSRVGSFSPNGLGVYDLSGNAQEGVDDDYSLTAANAMGVLRGGGWNSYQEENLYSGARNAVPPTFRDVMYGFRVVLAKVPQKVDR